MMTDALKTIAVRLAVLLAATALIAAAGCAALEKIPEATKDKTVAVGSDTWGGGIDATVASPESPVPSLSGWFGRRKVWYVSVKDAQTGKAAAEVVKASNSSLTAGIGKDGLTAGNSTDTKATD